MEKDLTKQLAIHSTAKALVQELLDILDAYDGKSNEEKKKAIVKHLRNIAIPSQQTTGTSIDEIGIEGKKIKDRFWLFGKIVCEESGIVLREVRECDRDGYFELRREYSLVKFMLREEAYRNMIWKEHTGPQALNLSIIKDGSYVGFCGINHTDRRPWEIAIELLPKCTNQGIGTCAIKAMLDAISKRLGVTEYIVKIDPTNTTSQKLFERIGAVPNRIAELYLHDAESIKKCEEENLHLIDVNLLSVAKKFAVEPRVLLSHVLEYRLIWR